MTQKVTYNNPFQIVTPEDLTAAETVSLFVDVFSDLPKVIDPGHTFLVGPRGSGKSMMFRYLMPDCQCLAHNSDMQSLPFVGIYVPLKNANFNLAELKRVEHKHASDVLAMHLLTTHVAVKVFQTLARQEVCSADLSQPDALQEYYESVFAHALATTSADPSSYPIGEAKTATEVFSRIASVCESLYTQGMSYTKKLAFRTDILPYEGALCDYLEFLLPLLEGLTRLPNFPGSPIYLLIDDAHWLSKTQAMVLNSWIATRTSRRVSLKVSTQHNYATYYTFTGAPIDTPHDFTEIDMTTLYTGSRRSKYRDRISDIVVRRLEGWGIAGVTPEEFFPEDSEQEQAILTIGEQYKEKHDAGEGRGYYRSDDAVRYARPDFIRSLAHQSKSSSTYSYAGFEQLVHLSSGIVRFFLEPAHKMFAETLAKHPDTAIKCIPPSIQSDVVRREAYNFLFDDIERLARAPIDMAPPLEDIRRLANLLHGLGGLFRQVLLSSRSERKVFSIALSDDLSPDVSQVLELGVQLGYFHKATLGRKDPRSGGRTRLFVLSKRLAPVWNLDPTGFAGYLFITNAFLQEAMCRPASLLRRIEADGVPDQIEDGQLPLF